MFRLLFVVSAIAVAPLAAAENIIFPPGLPGVVNVRDVGARGDGVTDDTDAIQAAIDQVCGEGGERTGLVYLPAGTYRLTGTLVANRGRTGSGVGPWIWGESRESVRLKLDDNVNEVRVELTDEERQAGEQPGTPKDRSKKVSSVLQLHPFQGGVRTSANWFMRNVRHMTIDAGDNPDVDGVRFFASNVGLLEDVTVVGNGPIGINGAFLGEAGPALIQNCSIDGFGTGIKTHWAYGQTLCDITISNCREVGLDTVANVIGVEGLVVNGTPLPVKIHYPNDWHWWSGVVALVGAELQGSDPSQPAISNTGKLFARNIETSGVSYSIVNAAPKTEAVKLPDSNVGAYTSHPAWGSSGATETLPAQDWLPIKEAPQVAWETDPEKWYVIGGEGDAAQPDGGKQDDTTAFQAAFDEAAARGCRTVAIVASPRTARNWYLLSDEVRVHGSVNRVTGLGWARIMRGDKTKPGGFVVDDESADVVRFENINAFGGTPVDFVNRSRSNTMVCDSLSGIVVGEGAGDIFATNTPTSVQLREPGQSCWCRQLNPETRDGGTEPNDALVYNNGGKLWVMGTKSEGDGRRFLTVNGGRTEIYGAYELTNKQIDPEDTRAIFEVRNAELFAAGVKEQCFHGKPYPIKLRTAEDEAAVDLDRKRLAGKTWSIFITP